jgi:hypothetical protein
MTVAAARAPSANVANSASGRLRRSDPGAEGIRRRRHDQWRDQRDEAVHDRMIAFGAAPPHLRNVVAAT